MLRRVSNVDDVYGAYLQQRYNGSGVAGIYMPNRLGTLSYLKLNHAVETPYVSVLFTC